MHTILKVTAIFFNLHRCMHAYQCIFAALLVRPSSTVKVLMWSLGKINCPPLLLCWKYHCSLHLTFLSGIHVQFSLTLKSSSWMCFLLVGWDISEKRRTVMFRIASSVMSWWVMDPQEKLMPQYQMLGENPWTFCSGKWTNISNHRRHPKQSKGWSILDTFIWNYRRKENCFKLRSSLLCCHCTVSCAVLPCSLRHCRTPHHVVFSLVKRNYFRFHWKEQRMTEHKRWLKLSVGLQNGGTDAETQKEIKMAPALKTWLCSHTWSTECVKGLFPGYFANWPSILAAMYIYFGCFYCFYCFKMSLVFWFVIQWLNCKPPNHWLRQVVIQIE